MKPPKLLGVLALAGLLVTAATAATTPVPVKASPRNEGTPAASDVYFSWAKSRRGHPHVYDVWAEQQGQPAFKVNAPKTRGWSGGIDGTRLVYQQVKNGNSDIRMFDLVTHRRSNIPGVNTKRWEWRPSISGDWLLYGRGTVFSGSTQSVILRNLVTGEVRVVDSLRSRRGFLQAGQVAGNYAVWSKCNPAPTCNILRYDITARTVTAMPTTGQVLYAPSVTAAGTTYYGRSGPECGESAELVKTTLAGATAILYAFPSGQDFSVTYAASLVSLPPPQLTSTRIYYDRISCSTSRLDIYSVDEFEGGPPP